MASPPGATELSKFHFNCFPVLHLEEVGGAVLEGSAHRGTPPGVQLPSRCHLHPPQPHMTLKSCLMLQGGQVALWHAPGCSKKQPKKTSWRGRATLWSCAGLLQEAAL